MADPCDAAAAAPAVAFIINRTCVRDMARVSRRCRDAAAGRGWQPVVLETTADECGLGPAREAVAAGARLVVAVGGDGTVRACAQALARTGVPLAIVPRGTANLAARALGVPSRLDAALTAGLSGRERQIDLADADGMACTAMAGIGLDAAVVAATPRLLKHRLGWAGYAVAGVSCLPGRGHEFTVRIDGGPPLSRWARCVVAGNVGLLPGGFVLLPDARLDDGLLGVGILAPDGLADWARVAYLVLTRSPRHGRPLERQRARRIEISAGEELPRQVDGEVIAPGRSLTVTVHPGALTVRVPATSPPRLDPQVR